MLSVSRDPAGGRARARPGGVARPGAWGLAACSAASLLELATKLGTPPPEIRQLSRSRAA
jgi:hypothetical protein